MQMKFGGSSVEEEVIFRGKALMENKCWDGKTSGTEWHLKFW